MDNLFSRWLPLLLWAGLIWSTSANPDPYRPLPGDWTESTVSITPVSGAEPLRYKGPVSSFLHAVEYVVLAVLTTRALVWRGSLRPRLLIFAFGLCGLYAISDEIHQAFVPGRALQGRDLALDVVGCLIGLAVYVSFRMFWKQRTKHI